MRVTANNNGSAIRVAPGASLDEHLFAAIDGDLDGSLSTNLNVPVSASTTNTNDYLYYYLPNRLGSVMGLLDATDDRYMLEYYRYTVYGEATVLPLYDTGLNQIEDTPTDLSDNNSAMLATRTGGGGDATAGRASTFNNQYTFTGRYLDTETGLHYYRFRYYESRTGRFISRDPAETPWANTYSYCENVPTNGIDPYGLMTFDSISRGVEECLKRGGGTATYKCLKDLMEVLGKYKGKMERFTDAEKKLKDAIGKARKDVPANDLKPELKRKEGEPPLDREWPNDYGGNTIKELHELKRTAVGEEKAKILKLLKFLGDGRFSKGLAIGSLGSLSRADREADIRHIEAFYGDDPCEQEQVLRTSYAQCVSDCIVIGDAHLQRFIAPWDLDAAIKEAIEKRDNCIRYRCGDYLNAAERAQKKCKK